MTQLVIIDLIRSWSPWIPACHFPHQHCSCSVGLWTKPLWQQCGRLGSTHCVFLHLDINLDFPFCQSQQHNVNWIWGTIIPVDRLFFVALSKTCCNSQGWTSVNLLAQPNSYRLVGELGLAYQMFFSRNHNMKT